MSTLKTTKIALFIHHSHECRNTSMLSLALVSEDGHVFYAEFTDFDSKQFTTSDDLNLITRNTMLLGNGEDKPIARAVMHRDLNINSFTICSNRSDVADKIPGWLEIFDAVEFVGHDMFYQWMLFMDLLGGRAPQNVLPPPIEISSALRILYGFEVPDIHTYSEIVPRTQYPTALDNAHIIMGCYKKMMGEYEAIFERAGLDGLINN